MIRVLDATSAEVVRKAVTLARRGEFLEAQVTWTPSRNGLYRVVAELPGGREVTTSLPAIAKSRPLDFVWWHAAPHVRWATVSTVVSDEPAGAEWLRERGILGLRWQWGPNYKDLQREGKSDEQFIAEIEKRLYTPGEGFWQDGYGIDEFGAYPQTPEDERGRLWIRALINVRKRESKPLTLVAWHAGGLRDDWMGLYKQAVDFLLLESYVLHYIPEALGTERIDNDLRTRIQGVRGAEAFTRPYGAPCKVLLSLDSPVLCGLGNGQVLAAMQGIDRGKEKDP